MGIKLSRPVFKSRGGNKAKTGFTALLKDDTAEFPQFAEFPPEIRLQIWAAALPGPRIVELYYYYTSDKKLARENYREYLFQKYKARTNPPELEWEQSLGLREIIRTEIRSPAVLYVCRESRYDALRRYIPLGQCDLTCCYPYFDPELDTIYINHMSFFMKCRCCASYSRALDFPRTMFENVWSKVQYLALDRNLRLPVWDKYTLCDFTSLKELRVVDSSFVKKKNPQCYKEWRRASRNVERVVRIENPTTDVWADLIPNFAEYVAKVFEKVEYSCTDWAEPPKVRSGLLKRGVE